MIAGIGEWKSTSLCTRRFSSTVSSLPYSNPLQLSVTVILHMEQKQIDLTGPDDSAGANNNSLHSERRSELCYWPPEPSRVCRGPTQSWLAKSPDVDIVFDVSGYCTWQIDIGCFCIRGSYHCVNNTGAPGTAVRSWAAQMVQDQIKRQVLPTRYEQQEVFQKIATRPITCWLTPCPPTNRLWRPFLLTFLDFVFPSRVGLMMAPGPLLLLSLILLFFFHLTNCRWGETSKPFQPDQSFLRVPTAWVPWGRIFSTIHSPFLVVSLNFWDPWQIFQLRNCGGYSDPCFLGKM